MDIKKAMNKIYTESKKSESSTIQESLDYGRKMEDLGKRIGKFDALQEVYEYLKAHGSNRLGYWLQDKMLEAAREITKG